MTLEEFQSILLELLKKLTDELDKQIATKKRYLNLDEESKLSFEMQKVIKENNISMIGFKSVIINDQNEYFFNKKEFIYKLIRLYEYSMGLRLNVDCFLTLEKVGNILNFKNAQKVSVLTIFINIFAKYYTLDEIIRRLNLTHKAGITSEQITEYALRLRTHLDKVETIYNQDGTINGSEKDENIFNTLTKFLMLSNNQANLVMNASEHILMSQKFPKNKPLKKEIKIVPKNTKTSEQIVAQTNDRKKLFLALSKYLNLNGNYQILVDDFIDEGLKLEIMRLAKCLDISEESQKRILANIIKHNQKMEEQKLANKIIQTKNEAEFIRIKDIYDGAGELLANEELKNDISYKYMIEKILYLRQAIDNEVLAYAKEKTTYEDYKELLLMATEDLEKYIVEISQIYSKINKLVRTKLDPDKKE